MAILSIARDALLGLEWLFALIIFSISASLKNNGGCFNRESKCNFAIAWGVIAWLILTALLVWNFLRFCTSIHSSARIEFYIQLGLVLLFWLIGGIAVAAKRNDVNLTYKESQRNAVVAFFWINFGLGIASAVICFLLSRNDGLPDEPAEDEEK